LCGQGLRLYTHGPRVSHTPPDDPYHFSHHKTKRWALHNGCAELMLACLAQQAASHAELALKVEAARFFGTLCDHDPDVAQFVCGDGPAAPAASSSSSSSSASSSSLPPLPRLPAVEALVREHGNCVQAASSEAAAGGGAACDPLVHTYRRACMHSLAVMVESASPVLPIARALKVFEVAFQALVDFDQVCGAG
jgi:hypothetical protein